MLIRLGLNAATHATAGFAFGVVGVLAACTVARVVQESARHGLPRPSSPFPDFRRASARPDPYTPPSGAP